MNNIDLKVFVSIAAMVTKPEDLHASFMDTMRKLFPPKSGTAQAFLDKTAHMTNNNVKHTAFEGWLRMCKRILEKGVKPLPSKDHIVDKNYMPMYLSSYSRKYSSRYARKGAYGGYGKVLGHFRWNYNTVYTFSEEELTNLEKVVRFMEATITFYHEKYS